MSPIIIIEEIIESALLPIGQLTEEDLERELMILKDIENITPGNTIVKKLI